MREYLELLFDELGVNEPWKPVSQLKLAAWLVFYIQARDEKSIRFQQFLSKESNRR